MFIDPDSPFQRVASPEEAVERLTDLHATATNALRDALERYFATGIAPDPAERARFRYPELRLTYQPEWPHPIIKRAYGKFQAPGVYATTVTQPAFFRESRDRADERFGASSVPALAIMASTALAPVSPTRLPSSATMAP